MYLYADVITCSWTLHIKDVSHSLDSAKRYNGTRTTTRIYKVFRIYCAERP